MTSLKIRKLSWHFDAMFDNGDPRVAPLFLWHFTEEIEHRASAQIIYDAVVKNTWHRLRVSRRVFAHMAECANMCGRGFNRHVPKEVRLVDGMEDGTLSQLPWHKQVDEEETGRISGVGMCHMDVFQLLLDDFGITKEQARRLPSPLADRMPQGSAIPADEFYVALATYGFSVEIPNAEWSARMARALHDNYGFSDQAVRWFTMHAELDADHGEEFRAHAQKVARQPGGLETLRAKTLALAPVVREVWNGNGAWKRAS